MGFTLAGDGARAGSADCIRGFTFILIFTLFTHLRTLTTFLAVRYRCGTIDAQFRCIERVSCFAIVTLCGVSSFIWLAVQCGPLSAHIQHNSVPRLAILTCCGGIITVLTVRVLTLYTCARNLSVTGVTVFAESGVLTAFAVCDGRTGFAGLFGGILPVISPFGFLTYAVLAGSGSPVTLCAFPLAGNTGIGD